MSGQTPGLKAYAAGAFSTDVTGKLADTSAAAPGLHDVPESRVSATAFEVSKDRDQEGSQNGTDLNRINSRLELLPDLDVADELKLPPLREQLTVRSVLIGLCLALVFCIIIMKLDLTAGIIPGFGPPSCLLGFAITKGWLAFATKLNIGWALGIPFTCQENTIIQTVVSAGSDLAFSGGYGSYYTALSINAFTNLDPEPGNSMADVYIDLAKSFAPF